ncbi:6-carboxytetrahydropterin synthase [Xylophilus ampelinus]|uniref:6-carboxy-5,6,7,8-tetrahydropterin synthase n=1 Tax=Xylophilus ampelinus TaxID=54067 RepID=A0A318SE75_9BURK|nr:6-carboxytetrahydropterin synthase [Xylophilus ampelinus]MCS4511059.1 6-carboxytetrahydropterin synthase [Xylophilus ampelinus]PYE75947.1 6-pyruvoyltetrahydropterin/6-carboxytetrahydropterin synthase [Xylophilus ampelinus]
MQFTVHQRFFFEAAHTLQRAIDAAGSRRIHGHTYHAEVAVRGPRDPRTGMVVDLGHLRAKLQGVRDQLDHHLLDEVPGLGTPTLENLCLFIARALADLQPVPSQVRVWRDAMGDACTLDLVPGA